jgi:hypothetical protein
MSQPIILVAPIEPETLNRMLQAASHRLTPEDLLIPNYRLSFFVAANGGRVTIPFPLPAKRICTRRAPLRFESDYYDPRLTIDVYCDEKKVNPYPLALTAPFEVDFGVYYTKKLRVDIVINNNTPVDATVTFQVIPHIISEKLYNEWYRPLIDAVFDSLQELAVARRAAIAPLPVLRR